MSCDADFISDANNQITGLITDSQTNIASFTQQIANLNALVADIQTKLDAENALLVTYQNRQTAYASIVLGHTLQ